MKVDDPPLTREEMYQLRLIRIGKPPTKATPMRNYFDPQQSVKFKAEKKIKGKR